MCNGKEKNINTIKLLQNKDFMVLMWLLIIMSILCFVSSIPLLHFTFKYSAKENISLYELLRGFDVNAQYPGICLAMVICLLYGIFLLGAGIVYALEGYTILLIRRRKDEQLLRFIDKWFHRKIAFLIFTIAFILSMREILVFFK